jgi:hypothetical protein
MRLHNRKQLKFKLALLNKEYCTTIKNKTKTGRNYFGQKMVQPIAYLNNFAEKICRIKSSLSIVLQNFSTWDYAILDIYIYLFIYMYLDIYTYSDIYIHSVRLKQGKSVFFDLLFNLCFKYLLTVYLLLIVGFCKLFLFTKSVDDCWEVRLDFVRQFKSNKLCSTTLKSWDV